MDKEKICTSKDLLQLIRESRNPLPTGKVKSEMIEFIDSFNKLDKSQHEYKRILSIVRGLANDIEQFEEDDYISLMSFFILADIDDYTTFLAFEQVKDKITKVDNQALFLKLLQTINKEGFSKLQLKSYQEVKQNYPLFWADIYFDIDIDESIKTLRESNLDFHEIEKPLKKWLKSLDVKNKNLHYKIEKIQQFVENFNTNESQKWLDENTNLFPQEHSKIKNYQILRINLIREFDMTSLVGSNFTKNMHLYEN